MHKLKGRIEGNFLSRWGLMFFGAGSIALAITIYISKYYHIDSEIFSYLHLFILEITADTFLARWQPLTTPYFGLWICVFALLFVLFAVFNMLAKSTTDLVYSSGIQLLKAQQVKAHANLVANLDKSPIELMVHKYVPLSAKMIAGNVFVAGQQGSGKSTIIKSSLKQLADKNNKLFVYDLKKEYQSFLNSKKVITISLMQTSKVVWSISKDVKTPSDAAATSIALIENESINDSFFTDAAREIVKGVLLSLLKLDRNWYWMDLYERLFAPHQQLHQLLVVAYLPAGVLIEENNKTTQSIRAVISTKLGWIKQLAEWEHDATIHFSLKEWLQDDQQVITQLLFQPNLEEKVMSKSICNAMTTVIATTVLSMPDSDSRRIFLVLDEVGHLPKSPVLEQWLSLSRSKGGRSIFGLQAYQSLLTIYGKDAAMTILSLFGTHVVLRQGAASESTEIASSLLGQHRAISINRTKSAQGDISLSEQFTDRPVVIPERIVNLPMATKEGVSGFLSVAGSNAVYELQWPFPSEFSDSEN